jgi:hypothetical protein
LACNKINIQLIIDEDRGCLAGMTGGLGYVRVLVRTLGLGYVRDRVKIIAKTASSSYPLSSFHPWVSDCSGKQPGAFTIFGKAQRHHALGLGMLFS